MWAIPLENIFYLFLIFNAYFVPVTFARDFKKEMVEGGNNDPYNGMWFGPRIGKRSLSLSNENDRQEFYKMLEDTDMLKYYYNSFNYYDQADDPTRNNRAVTKKVIFTPKLGRNSDEEGYKKMNDLNFTPRLGRRLPEKGVTLADVDNSVNEDGQQGPNSKNRYFSPRLGRTMTFSPRLGRDLLYDVFPPDTRIRVVRSVDKKNDTKESS